MTGQVLRARFGGGDEIDVDVRAIYVNRSTKRPAR